METPDVYPTTTALYTCVKHALELGQWSRACSGLDDLGLRPDNMGALLSALEYGLVGPFAAIVQDRIDLVNANARRRNDTLTDDVDDETW